MARMGLRGLGPHPAPGRNGNDTQGNDTQGNDTQGNDTQGNDTQGNDTQHGAGEPARRPPGCNGAGFRRLARIAAVAALAAAATLASGGFTAAWARSGSWGLKAPATGTVDPMGSIGTVAVARIPPQAVATLRLIGAGGPYPYEKDGVVFGNYERMLPPQRRGYYHEYTVPTPRARTRGARRIVCGGPLRRTDNCYYSDDHYASFRRIVE